MKTTYNWLREFCEFDLKAEDLARRLTMSGCFIEELLPAGDDTVLVAEVTSNRPDQLGTLGIAREVSALTGSHIRMPKTEFRSSAEKVSAVADLEVLDPDLCPRYTARVIRGVRVGSSPEWLRRRIEAIGLRPVNNVVDVTNYVLFECGQPLHAFDLAKLRGARIVVRRARDGEKMMAIDGTECKLNRSMLMICDAERPVAIAGVMGGLDTEISPRTQDVLLESAHFENTNIRRTSRALGIPSDASYRFERGVDPVQVEWASRRAAHLIQEVAGGTVCEGVLDAWAAPYRPKTVILRMARMKHVLGMQIESSVAAGILQRLGFDVRPESSAGELHVSIPPFRAVDVYREIDLIEEVIRIYGYDKLPEATTLKVCIGQVGAFERVTARAREMLTGFGYNEALTNSFRDQTSDALVSPWSDAPPVEVQNTIRSDENLLRRSLLPGLLAVKRTNLAHGVSVVPLFEISRVFARRPKRTSGQPTRDDVLPVERTVLALLEEDDLLRLKGALEKLLASLGITGMTIESANNPFFEQGLGGRIRLGDKFLGVIGRVSSDVAVKYDLPRAPYMAEVDFDILVAASKLDRSYQKLPAYPSAVRDLAVVVDEAISWAQIEQSVRAIRIPILESIEFFDVFRGKQVPKGKKSIAFSLTFRAPDRTLTSEEVESARQSCITALTALGGQLRA